MKKQFIMLLVTGILLILGWTIVEYLVQSQIQYQYKQVSTYPIMIYSWDEEVMDSLKADLGKYDFIRTTVYKSSEQSAADMIQKYGLDSAEDILQDNALPNTLIIYLKGNPKARVNKLVLKEWLDKHPDKERMMVEYQNDIWTYAFQRIDSLNQIRTILRMFLGLVIFIVFLLKRLHYEHHLARIKHLIHSKQTEAVAVHDHFWGNTFTLCVVPVFISFVIYQVCYTSDWLLYSISFVFFLLELMVVLAASAAAYPFVLKYHYIDLEKKDAH